MKKSYILYLIGLILVLGLGYLYFIGSSNIKTKKIVSQKALANFLETKSYLEKNFKGNYPIPEGDLILLNKKGEMLHLEDRTIPLDKVKDLYAIQGTTCDILKADKNFQKINYDARFSIMKDNKPLFKKCFTYSVTKNKKNFQIGSIGKDGSALIAGNSKKNIIKAYDAPVLVKNNQKDFLPYVPEKVSPIFQVKNLGNSKLTLTVEDDEGNTFDYNLKNGNNKILSGDVNGVYQIKLEGTLGEKTIVKFIDTNGSIVYIKGDDNQKVNFQLKDYKIDTNRIDYVVETGKFLANIVKLSPDKDMSVSKGGTTLVIRGTKFSINSSEQEMDTYLVLGKILQKAKDGEDITLDMLNSFSSLMGDKFVDSIEKLKQLVNFIVYNDILTHPKYDYSVTKFNPTDILSGNIINVDFVNGEKIKLIIIDKSELSEIINKNMKYTNIENICNGKTGCIDTEKYKGLVNNFCIKKRVGKKGLDLSKLYYILDSKDGRKFVLKDKIKSKLNIKDYVLLTSRYGGYNGEVNLTNRVAYLSNGKIDNVSLVRLKKYKNNIKYLIFACEY